MYDVMKIKKVTTSAHHPQTSGGMERVNHTMVHMLAVVVNEEQNDWDVNFPHVEFAYNNSVNQATGLAPNETKIPQLPLSVIDHPKVGSDQGLDRDQLEYCNRLWIVNAGHTISSESTTRSRFPVLASNLLSS